MGRLEEADAAYRRGDMEGVKKAHSTDRIAAEPWHNISGGRYIKDIIYASSDGIVTTFAIAAGATGAMLSTNLILILGFASLLADGVSMAIADYLGTQSELEYYKRQRDRESWEVDNIPEAEKGEIKQIFRSKGFAAELTEKIIELIASDKQFWIDLMMSVELGLPNQESSSPFKKAGMTFLAFVGAGFMPLFFFILSISLSLGNVFALSVAVTLISLFVVGAFRTIVTKGSWLVSGLQIMTAGGMAALAAYVLGFLLRALFGL